MNDVEYSLLLQAIDIVVGKKITFDEGMEIANIYKKAVIDLNTKKDFTWNEQD